MLSTLAKTVSRPLQRSATKAIGSKNIRSYVTGKEYADRVKELLEENYAVESDTAYKMVMESTRHSSVPAEWYFKSLYAVTKAFVEVPGQVTVENARLLKSLSTALENAASPLSGVTPKKVAVTGAAGAISYALLFRIASGALFGPNVPVQLQLLELPGAMQALNGVVMELNDCAFPLVSKIVTTENPEVAFADADYVFLVGAKPRSKGMERADLMTQNAEIFSVQGKALDKTASKDVRVLVVGNPANTNCMIAANNAPSINPRNFSAMTRLDHNRGLSQLKSKVKCELNDIANFTIWGNHSSTQYPSIAHCTIEGKPASQVINDDTWIIKDFIPTVQQRGAAIIAARGSSSAASAASAAIDHMRDLALGTSNGSWTSMAVHSKGEYGITPGLYYSYPVYTGNNDFSIVEDLPIDPFSAERMEATHKELLSERDTVKHLLK